MVPVVVVPSPMPVMPVVAMPAPVSVMPTPMAVVPVVAVPAPVMPVMPVVPPAHLLRLKSIDFVLRDDGWVHHIARRRRNGPRGDRRQWCSLRTHCKRCRAGNQCNCKIQDLSAFHDVPPLLESQSWPMEEILQLRHECSLNPS
jgi:hypothetical protein